MVILLETSEQQKLSQEEISNLNRSTTNEMKIVIKGLPAKKEYSCQMAHHSSTNIQRSTANIQ